MLSVAGGRLFGRRDYKSHGVHGEVLSSPPVKLSRSQIRTALSIFAQIDCVQ
jgi:hypothetical protein